MLKFALILSTEEPRLRTGCRNTRRQTTARKLSFVECRIEKVKMPALAHLKRLKFQPNLRRDFDVYHYQRLCTWKGPKRCLFCPSPPPTKRCWEWMCRSVLKLHCVCHKRFSHTKKTSAHTKKFLFSQKISWTDNFLLYSAHYYVVAGDEKKNCFGAKILEPG